MDVERLKRQFEAVGLSVDEERLAALVPVSRGLASGSARIAALDLGEREPALTFKHPLAREERER